MLIRISSEVNSTDKHQIGIDARERYHPAEAHIQVVREPGMNFETFGKIANEKQEPWKLPLPAFIEHIYINRFGKDRPADKRPIEEIWKAKKKKGEDGRRRKQLKKKTEESPQKANPAIRG